MKKICPKCGGKRFVAHQMQNFEVVVDGDNNWIENVEHCDSDPAYGPYICTTCRTEYKTLQDLEDASYYTHLKIVKVDYEKTLTLPKGTTMMNVEKVINDVVSSEAERYTYEDLQGVCAFKVYNENRSAGIDIIEGSMLITEDQGTYHIKILTDFQKDEMNHWLSLKALQEIKLHYGGTVEKFDEDLYVVRQGYPHLFRKSARFRILQRDKEMILLEVRDLNTAISMKLYLTAEEYEKSVVKYVTFEPEISGRYAEQDMKCLYFEKADKKTYPDFECWKADMLKSGVFEQI